MKNNEYECGILSEEYLRKIACLYPDCPFSEFEYVFAFLYFHV